ncbi:DoxX protein [Schinkia azotoformans MEV2011]|uniref:DoxX family protein n=3 Tax=Schinkia azotoformans TaxID=1454 RepID=K6DFQ6_SCHAZ|nr:DoxX family protein [Schinkia azotoformans]EKN67149.1 DoxX family protein [Schinkia azotoformans LMG 9581]KEF39292.1 DoxX protein [Schinkia azotoformans MEV2011]MEC1639868.1 DoxX family protein [Schinkia azotoformans]MEC1694955.1 DoxX family protein [Schinkia azotoformans]MEC1716175.1 DoxX family protein [Schinkia azotoformans]
MSWAKGPKMAIVWTIVRVWLGIQWITGGWHKVADGFDASGFMQGAIAKAGGDHPAVQAWYAAFLENVALPNAKLFSFLVAYGEVLVGIGLVVGVATIPALLAGAFMNLNFLLAGTTSTNPILFTVAVILLGTGAASYYYGGDRFLVPYIKEKFGKKGAKNAAEGGATV